MGGVVTLAYFNEYGTDDVDACVFQSCPLLGTDVAGDLLCRKLKLDARRLLDYATDGYPPFTFEDTLLWALFNGLYYSGLVDTVLFAGEIILEKLQTRVFDELMTPVFGTLLGLWAFVPDCSYEEAKKINLDPETQAGLIRKADYYHYQIQQRADEILNGAIKDGVRIMIVAGYDIQRTPLVEAMNNHSDATVDTKYASAGATVAPLDGTLGDGYKQKCTDCGHNHLSRIASTGEACGNKPIIYTGHYSYSGEGNPVHCLNGYREVLITEEGIASKYIVPSHTYTMKNVTFTTEYAEQDEIKIPF
jgi:hypothetical protein